MPNVYKDRDIIEICRVGVKVGNLRGRLFMSKDEIVFFESLDKKISLTVHLEKETVWLSQSQMIELFGRDQSVISRHINNAFKEELDKKSNMHFCIFPIQTDLSPYTVWM